MINPFDIEKLVQSGESENLEFKSSFNNELIETLVAFANTNGGKVIIGINTNNEIVGIQLNSESLQNWINEIKSKTSPSLIPDASVIEKDNKILVIFSIKEYPIKPVATRGKYFRRVKNSNHLLSISDVVNLHLQSFNTSWDFHTNNDFSYNDLSLSKVQKMIDIYNQSNIIINDDPITFLRKSGLIKDDRITNAAYLLFTDRDTVLTTIELGRFQTDTIIKDSSRTKSDILSQIDQVMDFVKKHINKEIIITEQPRNTQKWQYPLEAIREIITNMIVHRDYRSSSDSIVKVYDNKIEFYNPGRLPDSITIDDLLTNNYRSTPRNKLIADFCKTIGLIEKYGSGIQRIVNYFEDSNLPRPEFRNISEGFMVTVYSFNENKLIINEPINVFVKEPVNEFTKKLVNVPENDIVNVPENIAVNVPENIAVNVPENIAVNVPENIAVNVPENIAVNVPENIAVNVPENRLKYIIDFMKRDLNISMLDLSKQLNVNHKTIKRDIEKLKSQGVIQRIGPPKGGYWQVNN